jgi:hypothetical protein
MRRRDVVVLQHPPARQRGKRRRHRRRQREVKDGDIPLPRRRIGERPRLGGHVLVDRQREQVRLMTHASQQVPDPAGRIANRIAAVRRRHPLIDDHDDGFALQALGFARPRA